MLEISSLMLAVKREVSNLKLLIEFSYRGTYSAGWIKAHDLEEDVNTELEVGNRHEDLGEGIRSCGGRGFDGASRLEWRV